MGSSDSESGSEPSYYKVKKHKKEKKHHKSSRTPSPQPCHSHRPHPSRTPSPQPSSCQLNRLHPEFPAPHTAAAAAASASLLTPHYSYDHSRHAPHNMYTSEGHQHYEGATGSPLHPIAPGGSGSHIGSVPPQGRRYQTETNSPFPAPNISGPPPFRDAGGQGVWVGSAILEKSVHPCKLGPHLDPLVRVPYGGIEYGHYGRYDLLPVTEDHEWVPASYGHIPQGRRPVDGGYEESGERLHHAIAVIDGISVPGKTAPHLEGALVAFGNVEARVEEGYWILCWRD